MTRPTFQVARVKRRVNGVTFGPLSPGAPGVPGVPGVPYKQHY